MAFNAFTNVFRIAELRVRLAYTLILLSVYRLGVFINTPGVDRAAIRRVEEAAQLAAASTVASMTASSCAAERNQASNCEGGSRTLASRIRWK